MDYDLRFGRKKSRLITFTLFLFKYGEALLGGSLRVMKFRHPFSAIIAGPSKCGKTQFTLKLIENKDDLIRPYPTRVIYCYNARQAIFNKARNVEFHDNLDVLEELKTPGPPTLLILDDFMGTGRTETIRDFFTKYSHHCNISVVYLTQNLYQQDRGARDMNLSANYLVLFKNPRDRSQVRVLAQQMFPQKPNFLISVFEDAVKKPYSYLCIDLTQETPDGERLLTNIFDESQTVYRRV